MDDRFCAICERKLDEKDSEHVCRTCFRAARERKETQLVLSEQAALNFGFAVGISQFVNWGIQKLIEYCEKPKVDDRTFDAPLV